MKLSTYLSFIYLPVFVTAYGDPADDRRAAALEHISGHRELETCEKLGGGCWYDSNCCGDLECLGAVNWECGNNPGQLGEYCNAVYKCGKGFECKNGKCAAGCTNHHGSCSVDIDCCGGMECLGVNPFTYACGYTPGKKTDYCGGIYECEEHLLCHKSKCMGYDQVLLRDDNSKKCKSGSPPGELKVMTYNVFLINCLIGGAILTCDKESNQISRMDKMVRYMDDRDEDVVIFQELFNLRDKIIEGMQWAGFCHYVSTPFDQNGSGMAIFSKHPIEKIGFMDWNDDFTPGNPEAYSDKGVMYAKVNNGGTISHIFNTHTQSDSMGDGHDMRMEQYAIIKNFAAKQKIPRQQLILFGGDMNEDKFAHDKKKADYYDEMLEQLAAEDIPVVGNQKFSFDTKKNPFVKTWYPDKDYEERLDYIMVSRSGAKVAPADASCVILHPTMPEDCTKAECEMSDHFPVTCTIKNLKPSSENTFFSRFF